MSIHTGDLAMSIDTNDISRTMQETYDHYFLSDGYRRRYPEPNVATMTYLLEKGLAGVDQILDFGCGNGRYSLALLEKSQAHLTAYDISAASLTEFESRLRTTSHRERVTFVYDDLDGLNKYAYYDAILMLFGVLSHVVERNLRLQTLHKMRSLIRADGKLILSVPSVFRRRPWELFKYGLARTLGHARPPQNEAGNIRFTRRIQRRNLTFFYHLYSLRTLREELAEAGFAISEWQPESVFPEWLVTQSSLMRCIDQRLCSWIPAELGYGMRVLANPV
ncbi:bifunctional 2-polyprenyl-6-hydroxyphenol methylase/3-demethylubiquinol 3-O-methyltransferase UbiG [Collimonas sp. OK242]|jgi:SAM-dependent methyltransferase|uniref:class I SAM-dependent methyltransferase n=1 Tax=Collimonas sp. OK242 TaxID=1798195 RepID=UPI0015A1A631|nr:class I SAM-dependent methyltransferase [Collimonas sp. OK242]